MPSSILEGKNISQKPQGLSAILYDSVFVSDDGEICIWDHKLGKYRDSVKKKMKKYAIRKNTWGDFYFTKEKIIRELKDANYRGDFKTLLDYLIFRYRREIMKVKEDARMFAKFKDAGLFTFEKSGTDLSVKTPPDRQRDPDSISVFEKKYRDLVNFSDPDNANTQIMSTIINKLRGKAYSECEYALDFDKYLEFVPQRDELHDAMESAAAANHGFIPHTFFETSPGRYDIALEIEGRAHSKKNIGIYRMQCLDCGAVYNSLLSDVCLDCNKKSVIPTAILDGPEMKDVGKFAEAMGDFIIAKFSKAKTTSKPPALSSKKKREFFQKQYMPALCAKLDIETADLPDPHSVPHGPGRMKTLLKLKDAAIKLSSIVPSAVPEGYADSCDREVVLSDLSKYDKTVKSIEDAFKKDPSKLDEKSLSKLRRDIDALGAFAEAALGYDPEPKFKETEAEFRRIQIERELDDIVERLNSPGSDLKGMLSRLDGLESSLSKIELKTTEVSMTAARIDHVRKIANDSALLLTLKGLDQQASECYNNRYLPGFPKKFGELGKKLDAMDPEARNVFLEKNSDLMKNLESINLAHLTVRRAKSISEGDCSLQNLADARTEVEDKLEKLTADAKDVYDAISDGLFIMRMDGCREKILPEVKSEITAILESGHSRSSLSKARNYAKTTVPLLETAFPGYDDIERLISNLRQFIQEGTARDIANRFQAMKNKISIPDKDCKLLSRLISDAIKDKNPYLYIVKENVGKSAGEILAQLDAQLKLFRELEKKAKKVTDTKTAGDFLSHYEKLDGLGKALVEADADLKEAVKKAQGILDEDAISSILRDLSVKPSLDNGLGSARYDDLFKRIKRINPRLKKDIRVKGAIEHVKADFDAVVEREVSAFDNWYILIADRIIGTDSIIAGMSDDTKKRLGDKLVAYNNSRGSYCIKAFQQISELLHSYERVFGLGIKRRCRNDFIKLYKKITAYSREYRELFKLDPLIEEFRRDYNN